VYLTFAGLTVADFLDQARASIARVDQKVEEQKDEISRQTVELQAKDETIAARNREIEALHGTVTAKTELVQKHGAKLAEVLTELYALMIDPLADGKMNPEKAFAEIKAAAEESRQKLADAQGLEAQVKTLTDKLALQKVAMGNAMPKGLERLADGGIRLPVTVDKDMAEPLLSWANDAGEEPEAYIGKVLADALVSVVSS
jgi:type II secretory pathway component PulM